MPKVPKIYTSRSAEPVPFILNGDEVRYDTNEQTGETVMVPIGTWQETFTAVGSAPPEIIVHLLSAVSTDVHGRPSWQVPSLIAYLQTVLVPDDVGRFSVLMSDKTRVVEAAILGQVVEDLNEELFGRPLARRGGSDSGPSSTPTS